LDPNHHWIVLEEKPYRIQKSLSDLNGYDPYIHNGTVTGLLQALRNAFHNPVVSMADMKTTYTLLQLSAKGLKSENDWPGSVWWRGFPSVGSRREQDLR